ncbi:DUF2782 domain-containing protein [Kushneria sp. EE4]
MTTGRMLPTLALTALLMPAMFAATALAEPEGEVTTQRDGDRVVREYRLEGRLYAIEIVEGDKRTVLLDTDGDGNFRRQSGEADIEAPSWTRASTR